MHDLAKHNTWTTQLVLTTCAGLSEATLNVTVPGTYGTIHQTLQHIIYAEAGYLFRVSGAWPEYLWAREERGGFDVLASTWKQFLAGEFDSEQLGESRGDEGDVFAVPAGVFVAQAFHHASEHRVQICTILGALGHDAPDVSAWGCGEATARMRLKSTATKA